MRFKELPKHIISSLPPGVDLEGEIPTEAFAAINKRFPEWQKESLEAEAPKGFTFSQLPDSVQLALPEGVDLKSEIPLEAWKAIEKRFPESITTQVEFDAEGRPMKRTYGWAMTEATPTTDMQPIDVDGRNVESLQEATSKGKAQMTPEQGKIQMDSMIKEALQHKQDGIFKYKFTAIDKEGNEKSAVFNRDTPLTPMEQEALKTQMPQMGYGDFKIESDLRDDPKKVLAYLRDSGKLGPQNFDEKGQPNEELLEVYADYPSRFRLMAMGQDDETLKKLTGYFGDAGSLWGRMALGKMRGESPEGKLYAQARTSPDEKSGFLSQLGQGILQDPLALPSMAVGGTALTMVKNAPKLALGAEAALGAAEGIAQGAIDEARNLRTLSGTDYLTEAGIGAGLGAAPSLIPMGKHAPGMGFGSRELADYVATRPQGKVGKFFRDVREGMAETPKAQIDVRVKDIVKPGKLVDSWDKEAAGFFSKELGIPAEDLYPGLALSSRNSALNSDIQSITRNSPVLNQKAIDTKKALDKALDKRMNFTGALGPAKAGEQVRSLLKDTREAHFNNFSDTYANIAADPALHGPLDRVLIQAGGPIDKARIQIWEKVKKLYDDLDTITKPDPEKGRVAGKRETTSTGERSEASKAIDFLRRTANDLAQFQNDADLFEPGKGGIIKELEKRRKTFRDAFKELKLYDLPPEVQKQVNETYIILANTIQEGVEKVDPAKAKALKETNAAMQDYLNTSAKLGKWADSEAVGDKALFQKVVSDPTQMLALQKLTAKYMPDLSRFNALRDSWFKDKVLKVATDGSPSDKQRGLQMLLDGAANSPEGVATYFQQLYPQADLDALQKITKGMYFLGNPNLIGLGTEFRAAAGKQKLGDIAKNPLNILKSKKTADAEKLEWQIGNVLESQRKTLKGVGIPKDGKGPSAAAKATISAGKNLRALGTEAIFYGGARNVDDALRKEEKPHDWRKK